MKLAVFNPVLYDLDFEQALSYLNQHGVKSIEIGVGGFPGTKHLNAKELVNQPNSIEEIKLLLKKYDISICALSAHGNPLHPNKEIADNFNEDLLACFKLANMLDVKTVITFSGCPGDCDKSEYPNWVTCPWPEDFLKILDYQWDKLIHYWKITAKLAQQYGIEKIALEMHPGFCVYNPETLVKLRNAVGDIIGANFDPSHLIWQGIDVSEAIVSLGKAIHHFHAKDTKVNKRNCNINGVLDTKHYSDEINRSWIFRTVGFGLNEESWKEIFSALQLIGYNGAISIEHEDSLMTPIEGLEKAIDFLNGLIIKNQKPSTISWA